MSDDIELPDDPQHLEGVELELDTELDLENEPVELENVEQKNDDGKQPEEEEYGKKVQKRINKLVAERNIADEESNKLRTRLEKLEAREAERDSQRNELEVSGKISDIKRRKLELMDEGSYAEAEDLNDELLDLKIKQKSKPTQAPIEDQPRPAETQAPNQGMPEAQQSWIEGNDWYGANASAPKAQYANALYQELIAEGHDANDPDTYSELDKRLGNESESKPKRSTPPSQGAPDRGATAGNKGGKPKFTQSDVRTMRDYGLDPNDASQRSEWLRNKRG